MSEAGVVTNNETNTTVAAIVKAQEPSRIQVVTSENYEAYVDEQLGVVKETPEKKTEAELAKVEAEKATKKAAETDVESELTEHIPKDKKGKLNERFSELTAARKAAEEKAATEAAGRKSEREAREKAEGEAAALKAKYEPVKLEPDPEPQPSQFTDVSEYAKALKEWTADNTRRQDSIKEQEERVAKERAAAVEAWKGRQEAAKKAIPDYEETIANSTVKVSDQVRDAIIESEAGPQILHHLAKNPDVAEKIAQLTVGRALKEIGRLEATLQGPIKAETKEVKAEVKNPLAEISKAPPPISPIKNASNPVVSLTGGDDVPKNMTYEDWKALRRAGKIK